MARNTSSANPMAAPDRRTFLQKATAALGFLPLAGCTNDFEGLKTGRSRPEEPQPFRGPPVSLKIESLKPNEGCSGGDLVVKFEAAVDGVGDRSHENVIKNTDLYAFTLPHTLEDPFVIAISESGSVTCTCTFNYDPGCDPVQDAVAPASASKVANEELPPFKLFLGDTGYALSWEAPPQP